MSLGLTRLHQGGTAGRSDRIEVGDIYEDCAHHPVLCTLADCEGDELTGSR